jgi:anaerobic dimethyl sulfoxide reductase subunit B (iron-sulfur subunit)
MSQYGLYINVDACTGCKSCAQACKDKNDLPAGIKFRKVYEYAGGSWTVEGGIMTPTDVFSYNVSAACMHCASPLCFANCAVGAIFKRDDGIVYIDQSMCIGCGNCRTVCPYDAPRQLPDGSFGKCDLCKEHIDAGGLPACVASCRERCLDFGELSELQARYGTESNCAPLEDASLTTPSVVITRSRFNPANDLPGKIINASEELE